MATEKKKIWVTVLLICAAVLLCAAVGGLMLWMHSRPQTQETPQTTLQTTVPTTTVVETTTAAVDVTPPVITGAADLAVTLGETVSYRTGVTANDPEEGELPVQVDASKVNAEEPGVYPVVYWAEDAAGNRAEVTAQIEIRPEETKPAKKDTEPEEEKDYQDYAKQIYKKIIKKGMTQKEKIKAIWKWCHKKISFTGHSKKTDWQTAALTGFTKLRGDCYIYFATAKALLQEADIPTKDVVKIKKEGRSDHYWLLVKWNGSWYHFDACPRRTANGKTFCLYTDQQMLEFSEAHEDCFDFDLRKYPRTPGKIADKYLIKFYPEWFDENGKRLKDANGNLAGTSDYDPNAKPKPQPTEPPEETTEETTIPTESELPESS